MAKKPKGVILNGADFKAFLDDPKVWGDPANPGSTDAWYMEEEVILYNGQLLSDEEQVALMGNDNSGLTAEIQVNIVEGVLIWQGQGPAARDVDVRDIVAVARNWLKQRTTITLTAMWTLPKDTPADQVAAIEAAVRGAGGTLVGEWNPSQWVQPAAKAAKPKP